jgi:hypothetical protein
LGRPTPLLYTEALTFQAFHREERSEAIDILGRDGKSVVASFLIARASRNRFDFLG